MSPKGPSNFKCGGEICASADQTLGKQCVNLLSKVTLASCQGSYHESKAHIVVSKIWMAHREFQNLSLAFLKSSTATP